MGNQLVGAAPSQIYPVEHYLIGSFESDLQYESSMGSTRFFKVARAGSDEGLVVVKVFVKHDPSLPLEAHAERLDYIKKHLANAVNCLPFQRVVLTEKAGLIMREYVKYSLYDKILCALHQCHKQKIYHGDIKLENILITSWNWILLSDFASFKPTYLPEDNPSDYTYFFDTSRRRTCYIAPERFVKSFSMESHPTKDASLIEGSSLMSDSIVDESLMRIGPCYTGNLLPEMDIFSAGCALLELWSEGTAPFEFSQLLAYRAGDLELVRKHLRGIENVYLRNLIESMINRNPKLRKSAEIYLAEERGRLFPDYFYSFLQSYLQMFSSFPIMPADDKMMRLHSDISQIIDMLTKNESSTGDVRNIDDKSITNQSENGLIIITTVVTSLIRGLHHCSTKLCCLEILQQLTVYTSSATILDRILPYILYLTCDIAPRVRVSALDTLTECLTKVNYVPRSDVNVFPEYILPAIAPLATDSSVLVRIAYARNVARLAETAVRFLEQIVINTPAEMPTHRFESELNALHEMLQQTVSNILTDSQPIVKQTLMECGITKLCVFFGRQKANDLILSHMITFLNDKDDKNLRGSFYDCIVGVASFVGWQCSDILQPLLQQGLTDVEEFVIAKAIRATTALTELGLMQNTNLTEFLKECSCYLVHPNLWIRHEICGLVSTAAKTFTAIDVQCKLMPAINNYLKCSLIQIEKPEILADCLQTPIPRSIFDSVVRFPELDQLFRVLNERKEARTCVAEGVLLPYGDMNPALRSLFRRLTNDNLTELVEHQLISMKVHLLKLQKYKAAEKKRVLDGKISLDHQLDVCHQHTLSEDLIRGQRRLRKSDNDSVNSDWHHMFGDQSLASPTADYNAGGFTGASTGGQTQATPTSSLADYSMPERTYLLERSSECNQSLNALQKKMKQRYRKLAATKDFETAMRQLEFGSNWKMKGILVAHLHEHKSSVTRMCTLKPDGSLFASASTDGTVRLWDCNKLDGNQSINRSRQTILANIPIHSIAACDSGQALAAAGSDGTLMLLRIDPHSSKMTLQHCTTLESTPNCTDDGPISDMRALDSSQSLLIYCTIFGAIVCWDLRMPMNAWRLHNPLRNGVLTSLCVDPTNSWLVTGSTIGRHDCWDLRFRLPITYFSHPNHCRIRKVVPHPTIPSYLLSSSHGNNEVSIWNIESAQTGQREGSLWASSSPPLSKETTNNHLVCGMAAGSSDGSGFVITGGTDQRIRFWDLNLRNAQNCSLVVPGYQDTVSESNFSYDCRVIDGCDVLIESQTTQTTATSITSTLSNSSQTGKRNVEEQPRSGPELPSPGHIDVITDLLMCKSQKQTFVASSSRDGVIKLWK